MQNLQRIKFGKFSNELKDVAGSSSKVVVSLSQGWNQQMQWGF